MSSSEMPKLEFDSEGNLISDGLSLLTTGMPGGPHLDMDDAPVQKDDQPVSNQPTVGHFWIPECS